MSESPTWFPHVESVIKIEKRKIFYRQHLPNRIISVFALWFLSSTITVAVLFCNYFIDFFQFIPIERNTSMRKPIINNY